jgi:predicted RNA-binding Zn-ribbon protein involved in translation (DUF1610 family)
MGKGKRGVNMKKLLNNCACGSSDIAIHESGGYVDVICHNCGRQIRVKGEREEAIKLWNKRRRAGNTE